MIFNLVKGLEPENVAFVFTFMEGVMPNHQKIEKR